MTRAYFDSSCLLAILLEDAFSAPALTHWEDASERVSSLLFEAECIVTLRRIASSRGKRLTPGWLDERMALLAQSLKEITLQKVDGAILEIVRQEVSLSECRTLDAIHLATATFFQRRLRAEPLAVVSFDRRQREIAARLGFKVLPEAV
jgi:predicted nucleic acid-binding protein